MADNRGIADLPLEIFSSAMPEAGVSEAQVTDIMRRLSKSCSYLHQFFKEDLKERAIKAFLQAVIDDDREKVLLMLDKHPELLLQLPNEKLIIKSRHTWQQFYAEDALIMAVKRKQIEMIKIILPYYDKLPQTDEVKIAKAKAMSAWTNYDIRINVRGKYSILVPPEYDNFMQSLVDAFLQESFPNGTALNSKLSDLTEDALRNFRNRMLPLSPVKLDDYFDPELMLYVAYRAYEYNRDLFKTCIQRDHFCVKVIGFIQSVLSPETAKIFCEALQGVVDKNKPISDCAKSLKLTYSKLSFYRSSQFSTTGLGFDYLCGTSFTYNGGYRLNKGLGWVVWKSMLAKLYHAKAESFLDLMQRSSIQQDQQSTHKQPGCVIL